MHRPSIKGNEQQMREAGMDMIRMQLSKNERRVRFPSSFIPQRTHLVTIEQLFWQPYNRCDFMLEIRGRSIVIAKFPENKVQFYERGDDIDIKVNLTGSNLSNRSTLYINVEGLDKALRNGDSIYFEGGLRCGVIDSNESGFTVRTKSDGVIQNQSHISIPEKHSVLPVIRDEDIVDIENINKMHRIDFISIPYVSSKDDLIEIRKRLPIPESQVVLMARIDDRKGIEDFWEIANLAGGIILNRTNLATAFTADKLFYL